MSTEAASPRTPSRLQNVILWTLQGLLALAFLMTSSGKLLGAEAQVSLFDELGFGQWLRYLTGVLQLLGAVGLLIPLLSGLAATGLALVMAGAVSADLFMLSEGTPIVPLVLTLLLVVVAWGRRARILALRDRLLGGSNSETTPTPAV
ncbi:DoxX family protein [Spiractinospora alimapuensis]|uniref:DoxX family protein n=1 Tax=Spiractinospora alimapuensis TaxID=2820884 RepID=UPI001F323D98|nr:DoxX family protein [Spiractinospora alimapuensis]QVQ50638.1 DoxX family protein [Spiractinospora alimapuensis]